MKPARLMPRRSLPSISPCVRASTSFTPGLFIAATTSSAVACPVIDAFTLNGAAAVGVGTSFTAAPLFERPLRPAAVQQGDIGVAVVVEDPPEPRRVDAAALVVGDHARGGADAQPRHQRLELRRGRQEVGRRAGLANPVVVEPDRVRDVAVAVAARAEVDHPDVGVGGVVGQPGRLHQQLRPGIAAGGGLGGQQQGQDENHAPIV